MNEGKVAAMKALKKAFDAGDFEAAAEAFADAYELCGEYEDEKEESGEKPKKGGLAALIIGEPKGKG